MNRYDINTLAIYNAEKARGILHTPEWVEKMALLQQQFNDHQRRRVYAMAEAIGARVEETTPGGGYFITPAPAKRWWPWRKSS